MSFKTYIGPNINRLLATFQGEIPDRVPYLEILIEDKHVEHILGRPAGNTLGASGDVAKGTTDEAASAKPMDPMDYIELCQIIGQDAMIVEALWAPLRKIGEDGKPHIINDRSIKNRKDLEKVIPPTQEDIDTKIK